LFFYETKRTAEYVADSVYLIRRQQFDEECLKRAKKLMGDQISRYIFATKEAF